MDITGSLSRIIAGFCVRGIAASDSACYIVCSNVVRTASSMPNT